MWRTDSVGVLIPALNEEEAILRTLRSLPAWVDRVVVVDNGSTDATASLASSAGATVVAEPQRGYGRACLTGMRALRGVEIVVFLDADCSDDPAEMDLLVRPIAEGDADFVLGSRTRGVCERGSLSLQQRIGNRIACTLLRWRFGARYSDLGPFRAIRREALDALCMDDQGFGWTVQMQARAQARGLRVREVATRYRVRVGRSKISGTLSGCIRAGIGILATVLREPRDQPRWPSGERGLRPMLERHGTGGPAG
ncbi:MAG: glycosyltransferase family 2 protein [Candidatus Binatia bacterium]